MSEYERALAASHRNATTPNDAELAFMKERADTASRINDLIKIFLERERKSDYPTVVELDQHGLSWMIYSTTSFLEEDYTRKEVWVKLDGKLLAGSYPFKEMTVEELVSEYHVETPAIGVLEDSLAGMVEGLSPISH